MSDEEPIERCASVCDGMIQELTALRGTARKGQYDRQTPRQIDYAIRAVRRIAERIRALKGVVQEVRQEGDGDRLAKALAIAKDLRPVIAKAPNSAWKQEILRRLDDLAG